MQTDVAIIGAGFSGTMVAVHLLRVADGPRVVLIDRAARVAAGVAYGTSCPLHRLNVPASGMSALPEQPGDFVAWLKAFAPTFGPSDFVPRGLYARYLADHLGAAIREASPGRYAHVDGAVVDLARGENGPARVTLEDGRMITAARVVLATGHPPCASPLGDAAALPGPPLYIDNPWAVDLSTVPPGVVLLLGTGLTMFDVALQLAAASPQRRVFAVSRRGLLPQAHREGPAAPAEFEFSLADSGPLSLRTLVRCVRRVAAWDRSEGRDWRDILAALRPVTPTIWRRLSVADRGRFLRHLRPYWDTHRHRAAAEVARAINDLVASGTLEVMAARVRGVQWHSDGADVSVAQRRGESRTLSVRTIINCTAPSSEPHAAGRLSAQLRRRGLVREDPLCLGIDVDTAGRVINADGRVCEWLWTLGPPRRGVLWESTAVPEIRVQAAAVAAAIQSS